VRTDRLELAVWQEVCALLAHPERLRQEFARRQQATGAGQRQERSALEAQMGQLRQGVARLIDSYTEGLIEKTAFEPRVTRLRQRIAHIEAQCEALASEETLQRELHLIVSRLDDFATQVRGNLDDLAWSKKREIIRALVRRVEIGLEQVQVVFRVDSLPGEVDPEKKSLQLCRGSSHPTLRCTLVGMHECSRLQHARVQPLANQSQYASIIDPPPKKLPQMAPVQIIEKSTDIRIDYPSDVQRPTLLPQFVQRLMGTVALSEAMGKGMKVPFEDGLEDHHHRPLDNFVLKAGFPYRPLLPIVLLNPYPLDRWRHIPIGAQPLMQVPQVLGQVFSVLLRRDMVHAWGTALLGLVRGFQ
jgi:hypothetical protein